MRHPCFWLLLLGCGCGDGFVGTDRTGSPATGGYSGGAYDGGALDTGGSGSNAALLFADVCASCHGEAGQGDSGPDLRERVPQMSDASVLRVLRYGVGGMPAPTLDENEVSALFDYLRREFGEESCGTDPDFPEV